MNTKTTLLALVVSTAFTHAAVAQNDKDSNRDASGKEQQSSATAAPAVAGSTLTVNGTVDSIDESNRSVTLETDDGRKLTMNVGAEIQNFDEIKKGDKVAMRYTEAIAVALAKGDGDDVRKRVESTSARQPTQGRPGITTTERTTIIANVFEIDKDAGRLTLRGPQGDPVDIRVDDKKALNDISKGDQVAISFVEAAVVMIQPGGDASAGSASGGSGSTNEGNASGGGTSGSTQGNESGSGSRSMNSSQGSTSSNGASG